MGARAHTAAQVPLRIAQPVNAMKSGSVNAATVALSTIFATVTPSTPNTGAFDWPEVPALAEAAGRQGKVWRVKVIDTRKASV